MFSQQASYVSYVDTLSTGPRTPKPTFLPLRKSSPCQAGSLPSTAVVFLGPITGTDCRGTRPLQVAAPAPGSPAHRRGRGRSSARAPDGR